VAHTILPLLERRRDTVTTDPAASLANRLDRVPLRWVDAPMRRKVTLS